MGSNYTSYPDQSGKGANQSVGTISISSYPLPKIPVGTRLNSVKLTCNIYRTNGHSKGTLYFELDGDDNRRFSVSVPRTTNVTGNIDLTSYVSVDSNGNLSPVGFSSINLHGNHTTGLFINSTWTTSSIKITAYYDSPCTVTLNPTGGTVEPSTVSFYENDTYGTLPKPTREGYTFSYWSKENGTRIYSSTKITTDHTLIANWTVNSYAITANSNNDSYGTVSGGGTSNYGSTVTLTATPNTGYKVSDWLKDGVSLGVSSNTLQVENKGDATYTAVFALNTYTVTFKDENGATLQTSTVNYGGTVTPPTAPTKPDTAQHKYTFDGWYDANGNKWYPNTAITGDTVYTARFNSTVQRYTVKWYNEDGSVLLETDELVPYGTIPEYNGATPTKAETAAATYEHIGWSIDVNSSGTTELTAVIEAVNYYARFRAINKTYTVTWKNEDGTVLETDTLVPFGTQPDYNGATPEKASDVQYNYTFLGWSAKVEDPPLDDSQLPTVTGNITYTAVYTKTLKLYPIKVILFDTEYTSVVEYGSDIVLEAPEVIGYKFTQWNDGNTDNPRTVKVTGEATYQAVYERIPLPIKVNNEQVTGVYIVPTTQTIVYVISGEVPAVVTDGVTVDGWSFKVSNSVPDNSYPIEKLFINETRVY